MIFDNAIEKEAVLQEMLKGDHYRLLDIPADTLDYIIDIGALFGGFSVISRIRQTNAKVLAIEPNPSSFDFLTQNTDAMDIDIVNAGLSKKKYIQMVKTREYKGRSTFIDVDSPSETSVRGMTLEEIVDHIGLDQNSKYMIKIDCEGGERHLYKDPYAEEILRNAYQVSMELHFEARKKHGKNRYFYDYHRLEDNHTFFDYQTWLREEFGETHNILYHASSKKIGLGVCVMRKKEFPPHDLNKNKRWNNVI